MPKLGTTDGLGRKAKAQVKFFAPDFHWTWYAIEFDGEDIFFGLVAGDYVEFGTFRLSELLEVRGTLGLPVERDRWFKPTPVGELLDYHMQMEGM